MREPLEQFGIHRRASQGDSVVVALAPDAPPVEHQQQRCGGTAGRERDGEMRDPVRVQGPLVVTGLAGRHLGREQSDPREARVVEQHVDGVGDVVRRRRARQRRQWQQ